VTFCQVRFAAFVEPVHHERTSATDGKLFESVARAGGLAVSVSELAGPRLMQLIIVTAPG
jgi:hypothetical protein